MTDNPQQREFEAEWERHGSAIEPHEMIRYGMVKAIAFRYWQAALSQPAVAGAVDEVEAVTQLLMTQQGNSRTVRENATEIVAGLRTASSSQTAAEGDECRRGIKLAFDYLLQSTCNHWHGNPGIDVRMDSERKYLHDTAAEMLAELSPDDHSEWLQISDLQRQLTALRASPADDGEPEGFYRWFSKENGNPNSNAEIRETLEVYAAFRQQDKQS